MTRIPFPVTVALLAGVSTLLAALAKPGRLDIIAGVTLGTATAGAFAAVAFEVVRRAKASGGDQAATKMVHAFVGLMLARMIGYVALVMAALFLGAGEPISVCIGLIAGTVVFQLIEIMHLRKLN